VAQRQLDLFSDYDEALQPSRSRATRRLPAAVDVNDEALIAAIPDLSLDDASAFAAEAARRRLGAAVPALVALCGRFAGFGVDRLVPEQVAALQALASIGGRNAALAVGRMIGRCVVQGPTLRVAVRTAAQLNSSLPADILQSLLRHADPKIRADACRLVRPRSELISLLIDLLSDHDEGVVTSAACALGNMGRVEARATLKSLLRARPSPEVLDCASSIADEECMVELGRLARSPHELSHAALESLNEIDHPRAWVIVEAIRRERDQ